MVVGIFFLAFTDWSCFFGRIVVMMFDEVGRSAKQAWWGGVTGPCWPLLRLNVGSRELRLMLAHPGLVKLVPRPVPLFTIQPSGEPLCAGIASLRGQMSGIFLEEHREGQVGAGGREMLGNSIKEKKFVDHG